MFGDMERKGYFCTESGKKNNIDNIRPLSVARPKGERTELPLENKSMNMMPESGKKNNIDNIRPLSVARPKGERTESSGELAKEDIEATRSLFQQKNAFLANPVGTGFTTTRLEPEDFLADIFERTVKGVRHVPPFEEMQSPEYQIWLTEKKLADKKAKRLRNRARQKAKEAGATKLEQQQAAAAVTVPKIDYSGYGCWKYNAIAFYRRGKKILIDWRTGEPVIDERTGNPKIVDNNFHKIILQEDWQDLDWVSEQDFVVLSPITYVGRSNMRNNSRFLYALAFDLDGVGMDEIRDLFYQMQTRTYNDGVDLPDQHIPVPNIITNSGHGLHLYYILAAPIPLYKKNWEILNKLKTGLTNVIWNVYTSNLRKKDKKTGREVVARQYQSIHQNFRIPGSKTKFGDTVTSWRLDDVPLHTITGLNRWLNLSKTNCLTPEEIKSLVKIPQYNPDRTPLAKAEELWPEWYARVITQKQKGKAKWHIKRDLYDWWLAKLQNPEEVSTGYRYWCILTLVVYAVKCDIPEEEVRRDAYSLVPRFDALTINEENHFTDDDVDDAMKAYAFSYRNWPIHTIKSTTGINIGKNEKRKYNPQNIHLALARGKRDMERSLKGKGDWRNKDGRPKGSYADSNCRCACLVREWMKEHPDNDNKSACARDLNLTRPTVRKWWKIIEEEKYNNYANGHHDYLNVLEEQMDDDFANYVNEGSYEYDEI